MSQLVVLGTFVACYVMFAGQKYAVSLRQLANLAFVTSLFLCFAVIFVQLAFISQAAAKFKLCSVLQWITLAFVSLGRQADPSS